jgi:hypothetical protein
LRQRGAAAPEAASRQTAAESSAHDAALVAMLKMVFNTKMKMIFIFKTKKAC